ncbi:MAG TPA: hypothetical protein VGV61_12415, partial [Thermoanaerobaculia bacterium]|nr:hypothetical protein [Thermoanaerobaculia bacterium]
MPAWVSIGPFGEGGVCPGGSPGKLSGRIISLERDFHDTNILYAGSASGGLWKSSNGGGAWANVVDDLPHPSVSAIASHPTKAGHVWIGTGNKADGVSGPGAPSLGLLYRSIDDGAHWSRVTFAGSENPAWISKIILFPQIANQDVIFVATDLGVYRSQTYGSMWEKALPGRFSDLALHAPIFGSAFEIVAATYSTNQTTTGGELQRSTTGGDPGSWLPLDLPGASAALSRITLAASRLSVHETLYANVAAADNSWEGIWRSDDFGDSWAEVNIPAAGGQMNYNNAIAVDQSAGNRVLTGSNARELFRSLDGGMSWDGSGDNPNGALHEDVHAILVVWPTVFVANDGGVFKSTDTGSNFSDLGNRWIVVSQIYHLTVNAVPGGVWDGGRYYIGTQDNGVMRGPNEFLDWDKLTCCDGGDIAFKDGTPYSTLTGLSATAGHRYQYPTADICASWQPFATGLPAGQPWSNRFIYDGSDFLTNFG